MLGKPSIFFFFLHSSSLSLVAWSFPPYERSHPRPKSQSYLRKKSLSQNVNGLSQFTNLVWFDEFDNGIGSDWVFDVGGKGWGPHDLQYYRRENAYTENGYLVLVAKREGYGGKDFTSARLKTFGRKSWRYGRMEARIHAPSFRGAHPSFW